MGQTERGRVKRVKATTTPLSTSDIRLPSDIRSLCESTPIGPPLVHFQSGMALILKLSQPKILIKFSIIFIKTKISKRVI